MKKYLGLGCVVMSLGAQQVVAEEVISKDNAVFVADAARERFGDRITHAPFSLRSVLRLSSEYDELAKVYADLEGENEVYNTEDPEFLACEFPQEERGNLPATLYFAHRADDPWDNALLLTLHNEAAAEVREDTVGAENDPEDGRFTIALGAIRASLSKLAPQVREKGTGKYDVDLLTGRFIKDEEALKYWFKLDRRDETYDPIFGEVLIRKEGAQRKMEARLVRAEAEKAVKARFEFFRVQEQLKRFDKHKISDLIK